MAISGKHCHTLLLVCLAVISCCEGKEPVPAGPDTFRGARLAGHEKATPNEKVFNVLEHGAKPNGRSDNTQPFMQTWVAACKYNGNARVLIPPGVFKLGPVTFAGPCNAKLIVVQVAGTVKADSDISLYESPEWFSFEGIDNIVVTGRGTFDGQGNEAWHYNDCKSNSDCAQLPCTIKFNKVSNGVLMGFTSLNSQGFHISISQCQNIRVRHVKIIAPATSPNTDGIHISNSNNVKISRSTIATGDDCIGMIKGSTNIAVNKVHCGPGHGISVGSLGHYENEEDVFGITVKNCTFTRTDNGIRIKSWPGGTTPSKATGMIFKDLIMREVANPIIIDQLYCPNGGGCGGNRPSVVKISNIHYINIKGTTNSPTPVNFQCSPKYPCDNIQLFNIDLKSSSPKAISVCTNAKAGYAGLQNPPPACH